MPDSLPSHGGALCPGDSAWGEVPTWSVDVPVKFGGKAPAVSLC